ncbi:MAG: hypothetical protein ACJ77E_18525 [Gaiellaceae bacterium]
MNTLKNLVPALLAVAALAVAGSARADPLRYGVADDWPKFHPCGDVWWSSVRDIGFQDLRMTVQWDADAPTAIAFPDRIAGAIDCAQLNGVRPILAIYPQRPDAIGSDPSRQQQFAAFVALVGQAFPAVKDFIVGNEPNVNRFWQPQYVNRKDAAAADYEHTLARSYDALKAVRPDALVWGPAISSRGNDNPSAASNPSHSPVWFIKDMGTAYRLSGRTAPIFDEFNLHPYPPIQDTDPFSKKFEWPQAGAADLDRIKQALWDGFNGTGQPTVTEQAGGRVAAFAGPQRLPINLDEAAEQTVVTGDQGPYDGTPENVTPISEGQQAAHEVELAEIAACDPAVNTVLYFPLIDDTGIATGFQSGDLYAGLGRKQAYDAMKTKIASAQGNCQAGVAGISQTWAHTTRVIGATGILGGPGTKPGSQPANRRFGVTGIWTSMTAHEDATYRAFLLRVKRPAKATAKLARGATAVVTLTGLTHAYFRPGLHFRTKRPLAVGYYRIGIVLRAATNPLRSTILTSKSFTVGKPSTAPKSKKATHGKRRPKKKKR